MDKEREIEGIVEAMYAICDDCNDCPYEKYGYLACEEHQKAERIYEAGYRKADEVRKETAREFKQTMKDIFRFVLRNKGNTSIPYFNAEELVFAKFDKEVDREFLQEYGIEVDE